MADHILVHLNTVRPLTALTLEHAEVQFFVSQLPTLFNQADLYGGLVWHKHALREDDERYLDPMTAFAGYTPGERPPNIVTMAGWLGIKELHGFAHRRRNHVDGMKQLRHWIDRSEGATMALWWAEADRDVSLEEGWSRLERLRKDGPTQEAFTIQTRFDSPSAARGAA